MGVGLNLDLENLVKSGEIRSRADPLKSLEVDTAGLDDAGSRSVKEETAYARQLFLHGDGSNPPIKNIERLSKASGCPIRTLRDHVPTWRKESEELALRSPHSPYSIALSEDVLTQHQTEIEFLGNQVRKLRIRLKKTNTAHPSYTVYLSAYNAALAKWEKSSGILAHYETATAAMKEGARAAARIAAKRSEAQGLPAPKKGAVDASQFDLGD